MLKIISQLTNTPQSFRKDLLFGVLAALLFSAFIYFETYALRSEIINTLFGLFSLAMLLYMPKRAVLVAGFFIGLLWFYWIGYSFQYTGLAFITPIISFIFGLIYMLFFGLLALTDKAYIRAFLLFCLSFFEPFDFNWMQIELIFIQSYIGIFKYQFALVLLALSLPSLLRNRYRYTPLLLLVFALDLSNPQQKESDLKIKLFSTDIPQEKKWKKETLAPTVSLIFSAIEQARNEGYDLIILPESVFPLYLNLHPKLLEALKEYSYDIAIVTGALLYEEGASYNVSYMFEDGNYTLAKKMVLVPFGEYIPLPKFAQDFVNRIFFDGQADFAKASQPTDFIIKGEKFRNAICYEASCQEIYEGDVNFVIAISNNAWFTPSIEPVLQNLLLRYYARKNGVVIYHVANSKGSSLIK